MNVILKFRSKTINHSRVVNKARELSHFLLQLIHLAGSSTLFFNTSRTHIGYMNKFRETYLVLSKKNPYNPPQNSKFAINMQ